MEEDGIEEGVAKSTGALLYNSEVLGQEDVSCDLLKNVHFHSLDSNNESILWETDPDIVVMYHPDTAFVRQVELYQVLQPSFLIS